MANNSYNINKIIIIPYQIIINTVLSTNNNNYNALNFNDYGGFSVSN